MKAIVFDMDGVLFDTERMLMDAWGDTGPAFGMTEEEIREARESCAGHNVAFTERYFGKTFGSRVPFRKFWEAKEKSYRDRLERDGVPPKKGLYELLAFLKKAGYGIALATSTNREGAESNLTRAGILPCFDVLTTGDMFVHGKPHPEVYLTACGLLGSDPAETFAVEDSYAGLESARRAGMRVVMIPDLFPPTAESKKNTDLLFPSMTELQAYLETQE